MIIFKWMFYKFLQSQVSGRGGGAAVVAFNDSEE